VSCEGGTNPLFQRDARCNCLPQLRLCQLRFDFNDSRQGARREQRRSRLGEEHGIVQPVVDDDILLGGDLFGAKERKSRPDAETLREVVREEPLEHRLAVSPSLP
jgi:hypothetical protein